MKNEYLELNDDCAYPGHIHFPADGRGIRRCLLNGIEIQNCCYADTKKGVLIVYKQDSEGLLALNRETGEFDYVRLEGKVVVEFSKADTEPCPQGSLWSKIWFWLTKGP